MTLFPMFWNRPRLFSIVLVLVLALDLRALASGIANASREVCHGLGGQEYCPVDQRCHPDGNCGGCKGRLTEDIDNHECIDRVVFTSHTSVDVAAAVIWFFGAGLAMSAGVGGGGIFVPLGVILLRFASKPSTGLLINMRGRHPMADRPVIDMDMALFLAPMEMAGAMIGVMVQKVLPTWAVIILMAVILGYTALKTYRKGFSTLRRELATNLAGATSAIPEKSEAKIEIESVSDNLPKVDVQETRAVSPKQSHNAAPRQLSSHTDIEQCMVAAATLQFTPKFPSKKPAIAWSENDTGSSNYLPSAREWLERDKRTQAGSVISLLLMWATLVGFLALRGGKGVKGAVSYCSAGYWLVTALCFLWLFGFSLCAGWRAVSRSIQKCDVNYPFVQGDVVWSWAKFRFYSLLTFAAGVVAGLIGIGGGMVLGPMMLQLGVLPQVSSATTATMIVMTSSAAAFMFVTGGLVPLSYAGFFFLVAFTGAYIGKKSIDKLVKKYKLTAIIVLILATIIAFASGMMTVNGIIIYNERDWEFDGLEEAC